MERTIKYSEESVRVEGDIEPELEIKGLCLCDDPDFDEVKLSVELGITLSKGEVFEFLKAVERGFQFRWSKDGKKIEYDPEDYLWRLTLERLEKKPPEEAQA